MRPDLDASLVRDFPRLFRDRHGDTRMCDGFACGDGWEPILRRLSEKLEPIARETGLYAVQVKEKFGDLRVYVRGADGERVLPDAIAETVHAAICAAVKEASRTCEHCGAACPRRKARSWVTLCDPCQERAEARRAERKRRWRDAPVTIPGAEVRVWLDDVRPAPEGWTRAYTAAEAIALLEAGGVVEISLDHDLGDEATCGTGYQVATWIEEAVATQGFEPPAIRVHSANVVGRERMQCAIESIERLVREAVAAYADCHTTHAMPRSIGSGNSGIPDLSERVDEFLAEGFGSDCGARWEGGEMKPASPAPRVVRLVSGGQTGADRGGLDAALALGSEHGGWCPAGRLAEDGQVPRMYTLRETTSAEYAERTRANVRDSDGTVVFTRGAATGGSALTLRAARTIGKPVLHVDLAKLDGEAAAERVRGWCAQGSIAILNVAGSRESKAPGIGDEVRRVLLRALGAPREGSPK